MKWIRWVLLKIQSGHDSVHRRTDGQTDKVIPVYPPFNFVEAGGIISLIFLHSSNTLWCSHLDFLTYALIHSSLVMKNKIWVKWRRLSNSSYLLLWCQAFYGQKYEQSYQSIPHWAGRATPGSQPGMSQHGDSWSTHPECTAQGRELLYQCPLLC